MLQELKITVVDGGGGNALFKGEITADNADGKKTADGKPSVLYKLLNYNQTINNKIKQSTSPAMGFAITQTIQLGKQATRETLNYYISDIGRSTGDSNYQAVVNRKMQVVSEITGVAESTINGAASGVSVGGGWGALIGAVVGFGSSTISLGFKYSNAEREYQHEMFKENTKQAIMLSRANNSIYTGRMR